jgi:His-Xaa-Ser system protein HxsD
MKNSNFDDIKTIKINPKIYSMEAIYSASYILIDKAYFFLEGDPEKEIIVSITSKNKEQDIDKVAGEFLDELIVYSDYINRAEKTRKIREALITRAILTNDPGAMDDELSEENNIDVEEYLSTPEDIAIPWEEKHGKEKKEHENE